MPVTKRTILDSICCARNGVMHIRLRREQVDGATVVAFDYHRTSLNPGDDPAALAAVIDAALVAMGDAALPAREWGQVSNIVTAAHPPAVVAKFQAAEAEELSV